MSSHIKHLLHNWYPNKDQYQWVLGTIYQTQGSSYRKAGAHMLFNTCGEKFGLLSGGCLEADLQLKARQVLFENRALTVKYDTSDEDDINFSLGLGCGGVVDILLQPITAANNYLHLTKVYQQLEMQNLVEYRQKIPQEKWGDIENQFVEIQKPKLLKNKSEIKNINNEQWLVSTLSPTPHLLIIGGGIDVKPLVTFAYHLGWETSLVDSRPANARREDFPLATRIRKNKLSQLTNETWMQDINAAIVISHNIEIDADALLTLSKQQLSYCALLGPLHRQEQILNKAKLTKEALAFKLAGPAGLNIGAELPESIALSIIAECHAALYKGSAKSLSNVLSSN